MRIVFTQTTIIIDLPEETAQPARKPVHPLMLLEKLRKSAETEREPASKTPTPLERIHGQFLT